MQRIGSLVKKSPHLGNLRQRLLSTYIPRNDFLQNGLVNGRKNTESTPPKNEGRRNVVPKAEKLVENRSYKEYLSKYVPMIDPPQTRRHTLNRLVDSKNTAPTAHENDRERNNLPKTVDFLIRQLPPLGDLEFFGQEQENISHSPSNKDVPSKR